MNETLLISIIIVTPATLASLLSFCIGVKNSKKSDKIYMLCQRNLMTIKDEVSSAVDTLATLEENLIDKKEDNK